MHGQLRIQERAGVIRVTGSIRNYGPTDACPLGLGAYSATMYRMGVIVAVALALANLSCRSSHGPNASDSAPAAPGHANSSPADFDPQGTSRILRVNDETLTVEDVLEPLMPALTQEAGKLPGAQRRRIVTERIQAELIAQVQDLLLHQQASKDLTEPMMNALDRYVDQEMKDRVNREFGGRQSRFEAHLASMRMTLDDARESSRRRIIIVKYLQDNVLPRIADPTRRELLDYYHANMDTYTQAERRELYLIDIPKGDDGDQARSEAEQARARLAAGDEFEHVARELSKGIHAADGGSWGHISSPLQGRYGDASNVFFSLGPNQTSDIIETDDAFFIVRVGRLNHASTRGFAEVQPELVERYRNAQFEVLRSEKVRSLLEEASIEPREDLFLRAAVDEALERLARER